MGSGYLMKATITLADGAIHKGYFSIATYDLTLDKDTAGFFYYTYGEKMRLRSPASVNQYSLDIVATDYHFSNAVRRLLFDPINLYDSIAIMFNEQERYPYFAEVNLPVKINTTTIRELSIDKVYIFTPGFSTNSLLVTEDLQWLQNKKAKSVVNLSGSDLCGYEALLFDDNRKKISNELERLKKLFLKEDTSVNEGKYQELQKEIRITIERLKKEKVIITSFCSC